MSASSSEMPRCCLGPFLLLAFYHREVMQPTAFLEQFCNPPAKALTQTFQAELLCFSCKWIKSFKVLQLLYFYRNTTLKFKWSVDFAFCNPRSLTCISFLTVGRAETETKGRPLLNNNILANFGFILL